MADGGMASGDVGLVGRNQAVQIYKALSLYPKNNGEPLTVLSRKDLGTSSHVVNLTLAIP